MSNLIHTRDDGTRVVRLDPTRRVLFLTKDLELIRKQLRGEVDLRMADVDPADLLDDINTDVMTPAWVCFRHRPEDIALDAYAGLVDEKGERVFGTRALLDGGFQVIVSGQRKGTGSSRETAPQCEKWSGIELVIASSFAPIHERNNVNLGQIMGDHALLERLQAGEEIPLEEFTGRHDPITRAILEAGGLFAFVGKVQEGEIEIPLPATAKRPMTMAEKIVRLAPGRWRGPRGLRPARRQLPRVKVDGGFSHEFTTAQVHHFLASRVRRRLRSSPNPSQVRRVRGPPALRRRRRANEAVHERRSRRCATCRSEFQRHTGVRDYSATRRGFARGSATRSPARSSSTRASSSRRPTRTPAWAAATTRWPTAWAPPSTRVWCTRASRVMTVPESIRFELTGSLREGDHGQGRDPPHPRSTTRPRS